MTGDLFSDFLQQIPFALIIQICLAGSLLAGAIVYFRYIRKRRTDQPPAEPDNPAPVEEVLPDAEAVEPDSPPEPAALPRIDMGLLPDLDLLVDSPLADVPPAAPQTAPPLIPDEPPKRVSESGTYTLNLHSGQTATAKEVLTILRDADDDRLIVQIGDIAYRTLVDNPDTRKQFTQIMRELSDTVTKPDARVAASPEVEAPTSESMPDPIPAEVIPEPLSENDVPDLRDLLLETPEPTVESTPPPITPEGDMPGDLPSFRLEDHPVEVKKRGLLRRKKVESAPVPELDIAASIEAYLQHKLKHTAEYTGRKIHVHSAPGGGVRIQVDEQYYDAVGDVDDAAIREFMAATIQEWQDRQ
jgi:hypothetical protein